MLHLTAYDWLASSQAAECRSRARIEGSGGTALTYVARIFFIHFAVTLLER